MSEKRYISLTGIAYTFPVFPIGGKIKYISLAGPQVDLYTSNLSIQKAIERSKHFKSKKIGLAKGYDPFTEEELTESSGITTEDENKAKVVPGTKEKKVDETKKTKETESSGETAEDENSDIKAFDDVKDWQKAKDILRGEPYNIAFQSLNTPANILKQAELNKVSFPNLQL